MVDFLKPDIQKVPLYEALREMLVLEKETMVGRIQIIRKRGDAILGWSGMLSAGMELADQKLIEATMKPAIEEIEKGFDAMIVKMDNLISEATKEKEKKP